MFSFSEIVETRTCRVNTVTLIGFQGQSMDEEENIFDLLNERINEISARKNKNRFLVVSGKFPTPFVAVEVTDVINVPEGMKSLVLPDNEYVAFKFRKEYVGDFWANVCTSENIDKYNIDLSKPRYEIFTQDQDSKYIEWYIPKNN